MAENDPYLAARSTRVSESLPCRRPPLQLRRAPRRTPSRIFLLVALAVCVALLGTDLARGQYPLKRDQKKLVDAMAARSPADDDEKPAKGAMISGDLSPLTADEVHKILGRDPAESVSKPAKLGETEQITETYNYPGVFRKYTLTCSYYKTPKQMGGTALKRVEAAKGFWFGH